jgi:hypothetical protein
MNDHFHFGFQNEVKKCQRFPSIKSFSPHCYHGTVVSTTLPMLITDYRCLEPTSIVAMKRSWISKSFQIDPTYSVLKH